MPVYSGQLGLFEKMFGALNSRNADIMEYTVEAATGEKIYSKQVSGKEELIRIFRAYYEMQRLPDLSDWTDTGLL